jgi:hypothetical protein
MADNRRFYLAPDKPARRRLLRKNAALNKAIMQAISNELQCELRRHSRSSGISVRSGLINSERRVSEGYNGHIYREFQEYAEFFG